MPKISQELIDLQRKPRFGTTNPEQMRMELWERMALEGRDLYDVRRELGVSADVGSYHGGSGPAAPDWTWYRLGQSVTPMPDGREILIAGEHEDFYDPDFCIYNDVMVRTPEGGLEIYGYPEQDFPPTDFHSATLLGSRILIIGCKGYARHKAEGTTPVFELDTRTYAMRRLATTGEGPGWINQHTAVHDPEARTITVYGGNVLVTRGDSLKERENLGRHRLHLDDMRWEAIVTGVSWRHFRLEPPDGPPSTVEATLAETRRSMDAQRAKHLVVCGVLESGLVWNGVPPFRRKRKGEYETCIRTTVDGVPVRISVESYGVSTVVIFEGELPGERVDWAINRLLAALSEATGEEWEAREDELC